MAVGVEVCQPVCRQCRRCVRPQEVPAVWIRIEPDPGGKQLTDHSLRNLSSLLQPLQHPRDAALYALLVRPARRLHNLLAWRLQPLQLRPAVSTGGTC